MRRIFLTLAVLALTLTLAGPTFSDEPKDYRSNYGYGCGWGPGSGWSSGHMMGPGGGWRGGDMMGPGHRGWGKHGPGCGMCGRCCGLGPRALESMTPEQRQKLDNMWSSYQKETLELRKQLVTKQMELETLWAQPDVDRPGAEKLSEEIADLQAQLSKKRDKCLVQCRNQFGDLGWTCPGGWW